MSTGPLGCAQGYSAQLRWRISGNVYGPPIIEGLTAVEWGRTINDVSEATITVSRQSASEECCTALSGTVDPKTGRMRGGVEPWMHELAIFRDGELMWEGPIVTITNNLGQNSITVEAQDVITWLDHTVNTWRMSYRNAKPGDPGPDPRGRKPGPVGWIAWHIINMNVVLSSLSQPPDWCRIMDYIVYDNTSETIRFEKDGSSNRAVWAQYVGVILRELVKRGLAFTTVGRRIVLGVRPTIDTKPVARLGADHFAGDLEITRDGSTAATASWATNQQDQDITGGFTEIVGEHGTPYGRLDSLVAAADATDEQGEAEIREDLQQAAADDVKGRYPAPWTLSVPDGAQLSYQAPIGIDDLVCGQRIDVYAAGKTCMPITMGYMLSDVSVSWADGGEQVAISLIPLADPFGDPIPPDPDP